MLEPQDEERAGPAAAAGAERGEGPSQDRGLRTEALKAREAFARRYRP